MSKTIAFWGAHGAGTTTLVCGFAKYLASQRQNVAVVCCDTLCPTIPQILPHLTCGPNSKNTKSIGKILSAVEFSDNDILKQCVTTDAINRTVFLGYAYGEQADQYPESTDYDIYNFFSRLSSLVDFILVDCSPDLSNRLTNVALDVADNVIRVCGCSYKDLTFFASNLPDCPQNNTPLDHHIIVFPKVQKNDVVQDTASFYGAIDYTLNYNPKITEAFRNGLLLASFPPDYMAGIKIIVEEMGFIE